jgi:hypothetical protein
VNSNTRQSRHHPYQQGNCKIERTDRYRFHVYASSDI